MLKFFRRIRRKLIDEGNLKRYLIYAIGEILLVMIGILLALQVNNWNEKRKGIEHEIKLLTQLNSDLKLNLNEINNFYETTILRSQAKDSILFLLNNRTNNNEQLKVYLHEIPYAGGIFNNANTTYNSIESGGINVISNEILRSKITTMYEEEFRNIEERRKIEYDIITQHLKPIVHSKFVPSKIASKRFPLNNLEVLNYPGNPSELTNNQKFINALTELQEFTSLRRISQARLMEKIKELILEIDKEIEELKK